MQEKANWKGVVTMKLIMNKLLLVENPCVVNGIAVNEIHFGLRNGFYLRSLYFPPNIRFSYDNLQLQGMTRFYSEALGEIPIRKPRK